MATNTTKVTLGEVDRKLSDHIEEQAKSDIKRDEFELYMRTRLEDLNLILRVFKWIGWAVTIGAGTAIAWAVNTFLNR